MIMKGCSMRTVTVIYGDFPSQIVRKFDASVDLQEAFMQLASEITDREDELKDTIQIPVAYDKGHNWDFVFVDHGDKKVMSVF